VQHTVQALCACLPSTNLNVKLNTKLNTKLKSNFNIKLNNLKDYNNIFFKLNNKKSKVYIIKNKIIYLYFITS
jgi:hypothetical protein